MSRGNLLVFTLCLLSPVITKSPVPSFNFPMLNLLFCMLESQPTQNFLLLKMLQFFTHFCGPVSNSLQ